MKKTLLSLTAVAVFAFGATEVKAQTPYKTAIGLGIDLGDGPTGVGPQIKHHFSGSNVGQAQVLFGDGATVIGVDYQYTKPLTGANGLNWYLGVGPQLEFSNSETYFAIRPQAGLEYKIPAAPLAVHFDWKPWWNLSDDSHFAGGRFSIGFKFALR